MGANSLKGDALVPLVSFLRGWSYRTTCTKTILTWNGCYPDQCIRILLSLDALWTHNLCHAAWRLSRHIIICSIWKLLFEIFASMDAVLPLSLLPTWTNSLVSLYHCILANWWTEDFTAQNNYNYVPVSGHTQIQSIPGRGGDLAFNWRQIGLGSRLLDG